MLDSKICETLEIVPVIDELAGPKKTLDFNDHSALVNSIFDLRTGSGDEGFVNQTTYN